MNPLEQLQAHLDDRLDRLETKLDTYSERLVRAESDLGWLRGTAKWALSVALAAVGALVGAAAKLLDITPKH